MASTSAFIAAFSFLNQRLSFVELLGLLFSFKVNIPANTGFFCDGGLAGYAEYHLSPTAQTLNYLVMAKLFGRNFVRELDDLLTCEC